MIYTYYELQQQVLRRLDEVGQEATEANVKDYINNAHVRRVGQHRWSWTKTKPTVVYTVAGEHEVVLKHNLSSLLHVKNLRTGQRVDEITEREFEKLDLLSPPAGPVVRYMNWGTSPTARQPSTPIKVRVVSSSTSDVGSDYQFVVKGEDEDGNEVADLIIANGTIPVTGTVTFRRILGYAKLPGQWNGILTLTSEDAATTFLTLFPYEMGRQYQSLWLIERPGDAEPIQYRGYVQPLLMVNPYDQPLIPGGNSLILVYDALLEASTYIRDINPKDVARWQRLADEFERNLYNLELGTVTDTIDLPDDGWDDTF
jgi:hypothetical protein